MPNIEQLIFMYSNFDRCRPQIMDYESARSTSHTTAKHPKESKKEAMSLLRCHAQNLSFEPICLETFNDARECLFKLDGHMRLCKNELELFDECREDPVRYEKFQSLTTPI